MSMRNSTDGGALDRRGFLQLGAAGLALAGYGRRASGQGKAPEEGKPTQVQIACMTLPYAQFPLERALSGIKTAGFRYVAWGTSHKEKDGKNVPILPADAPAEKAKELGKRCRDLGLEPLMMFSGIYPEAKN